MVEFALVLPILLLVLFGIFDFGRAINYWIDATHMSNEAAATRSGRHTGGLREHRLASCVQSQADSYRAAQRRHQRGS